MKKEFSKGFIEDVIAILGKCISDDTKYARVKIPVDDRTLIMNIEFDFEEELNNSESEEEENED